MTKEKETENITNEVTAVLEEIVEDEKPQKGKSVLQINETEYMVDNRHYKLVKNYRNGFDPKRLGERYSEVLTKYDYIVGDWGFEQLRLKGFFAASNKKAAAEQRIDMLEDYLYEYCNFGCAYFIIERIGRSKDKNNRRRKKQNTHKKKTAHIEEKREKVSKHVAHKPVIKKKQQPEKNAKKVIKEQTRDFVIRKKEDQQK